jgi:hypothetical protein
VVCDGSSPVSLSERFQIGLFLSSCCCGRTVLWPFLFYSTFSKCRAANREYLAMSPFIPFFDSMADLLESKAGASDVIGGGKNSR